jgi:hypothetical protein
LSSIDEFAASLLEEAKHFLEKARTAADDDARNAFLHAALMLGFCALEAHVNATADEFAPRPELSVHERAILLEQEVRFDQGEFRVGGFRMFSLQDRILFLHSKFGGKPLDRTASWWAELSNAITLRNQLTHPKSVPSVSVDAISRAVLSIITGIDVLFQAVYRRRFPVAARGLDSRLVF